MILVMDWDSKSFPEKAKLFCQSQTALFKEKTAHTCLCTLRRKRQTNCPYTTLTHTGSCSALLLTVIAEKDPGKQEHDYQWSERKALHHLPHRNCRILTTLNALCADTNAALQLQKDPHKTPEHTTLKTFFTPHHHLHTSNILLSTHTCCQGKSKFQSDRHIYHSYRHTSSQSVITSVMDCHRQNCLAVDHSNTAWADTGTRKGTQTQWSVI